MTTTTDRQTKPIALPLAHARGVIIIVAGVAVFVALFYQSCIMLRLAGQTHRGDVRYNSSLQFVNISWIYNIMCRAN